jgi:HEAT repeat protein
MVLSLGGRKFLLKESDYQACIREQEQPAWKRSNAAEVEDTWGFLSDPAWHESGVKASDLEHDPSEIPQLIRLLRSGDKSGCWDAADALCELGPLTPEVVPALLDALSDSESGYLASQGLAVMSLKDESIVPKLIEILRSGKGKATYWAAVSLEEIGLQNAKAAIPLIVAELESQGDIKTTAAKALAGAGADAADAVPHLVKLLANGDSWECKCAVIALGRIGSQAHDALGPLTAMFDSDHDYRFDIARALWKISPEQAPRIVPVLIAELESQRNPGGPNKPMDYSFFSAMELLGEIGPGAKDAIPILRTNLKGGAKFDAAWALWRIDPGLLEEVTPVLTEMMGTSTAQPGRLDRLAQGSKFARIDFRPGNPAFDYSFGTRMATLGAIWQMHPGKRDELSPLLVTLLREWERGKVLNELTPDTRAAIPALEYLLEKPNPAALQFLAEEALQKIKTTDPGRW